MAIGKREFIGNAREGWNAEVTRRTPGLLDAIMAGSYDGICIMNPDRRIVAMNGAYERLVGVNARDWIGRTDLEMRKELGFDGVSLGEQILSGCHSASRLLMINNDVLLCSATSHFNASNTLSFIIINVRNLTALNQLRVELEDRRISGAFADLGRWQQDHLICQLKRAGFNGVVACSSAMKAMLSTASRIAGVDAPVLIYGETGTGKGMLSRIIHKLSPRCAKPLVEVNCATIPETLFETELFGYAPGAFTGSLRSGKRGLLELAEGGTMILDEISELSLRAQAKLLKFLDDKSLLRVGGTTHREIDARIVAITNKDLRGATAAREFRQDLFFRLDVLSLYVPPLRDRPEDISGMVLAFLDELNRQYGERRVISSEAFDCLARYSYPGNVRELRHVLTRLVLTAAAAEIRVSDLPADMKESKHNHPIACQPSANSMFPGSASENECSASVTLKEHLVDAERRFLASYADGCKSTHDLGKKVGLHHSSVIRKLRKYGITIK